MVRSTLKAKLAGVILLTALVANCSGKTYSTFLQPFDLIFGSRSGGTANSADSVDLVSATPMTPTRVKLTFDEPVTLGTAETAANYSIKAADGTSILILAVTRDPFDSKVVYIDTAPQVSGTQYTVTVGSIVGVDGSLLGSNNTASFTAPSNADQSKPTINMVQANTSTTAELTFNEAVFVDPVSPTTATGSANRPANYTIHTGASCAGGAALTTSTVTRSTSNFGKVTLVFTGGTLNNAGGYSIKVNNVQDQWGNAVVANSCSPLFAAYSTPAAPSVSSIIAPSTSTVLVTYSTAMDTAVADLTDRTKYTINTCNGGGSISLPTNGTATTSTTVLFTGVTTTGTVNTGQCSLTVTTGNIKSTANVLMTAAGNKGVLNYTTADSTAPQVLSVTATDRLTVKVVFNEIVSSAAIEANPTAYFSFSPALSIASPSGVACSSPFGTPNTSSTCTISLSAAMTTQTYTLTTSGVKDVAGNTMSTGTNTFTGDGAPYIVAIIPAENGTVYVQWSEAIGDNGSVTTGDYTINPGALTPTTAALYPPCTDPCTSSMVKLTFSPVLTSGTSYTLSVNTPTGSVDSTNNPALGTVPNGGAFTSPQATVPLRVTGVTSPSVSTIRVTFSEPLDNSTISTGNFSLDTITGTCPTAVTAATQVSSGVVLLTVTSVNNAAAADCRVRASANLKDLFGNAVATSAVTFTDTGDLVNLNNHGLTNGQAVSFTTITTTTGISINTGYYVVNAATNSFQVSATSGGAALALTSDGNGTAKMNDSGTFNYIGTVGGVNTADSTAPTVLSVTSTGNNTINVYFSEPIVQATGEAVGNYVFSPALTTAHTVSCLTPFTMCTITTPAPGQSGVTYSLTVSGVQDTASPTANTMASQTVTFGGTGGSSGTGGTTGSPTLYFASLINPTTLEISFSEAIDQTTSQVTGSYSVTGSQSVTAAVRQSDPTKVRLTLSPGATGSSTSYTVSATAAITDIAGNALTAGSVSFFGSGNAPTVTDLVAASDTGTSSTDNITAPAFPSPGLAFTGTVAPNTTVVLYDGGVPVATVTSDASGVYTVTVTSAPSTGNHSYSVGTVSTSGVASDLSPALIVNYDTAVPTTPGGAPDLATASDLGVSSTDNNTSATSVTFTAGAGTIVPGSSLVRFYSGATLLGSGTANADGSYSIAGVDLSGIANAGATNITVKTVSVSGVESAASTALSVTVDTTGPTAPVTAADLVAATDTGASTTDNVTSNNASIQLSGPAGSAVAGAIVHIYSSLPTDPTEIGQAIAAGDGSWTWTMTPGDTTFAGAPANMLTLATSLSNGTQNITYRIEDLAGNTSTASAALSVTVDTSLPATPAAAPAFASADDTGTAGDGITSNTTALTFTGTVEANATVNIYDNGVLITSTTADASGNYSIDIALAAGAHPITVKAQDAAGNLSAASPITNITVDTTAPATPAAAPALTAGTNTGTSNSDGITNLTSGLAFSAGAGAVEGSSTVQLYDGGTLVANVTAAADGSYSFTGVSLTAGAHSLTIKAVDAANNTSAASPALALTIDSTAPAINSSTVIGSNAYIDVVFAEGVYGSATAASALSSPGAFTLNFVAGGATGASILSIKKPDGATSGAATALTGGETTVRVFLTITGTPNGTETVTLTAAATSIYDNAGNVSSATTGAKSLNATGTANIQSGSYTALLSTTGYVHVTFTEGAYTNSGPASGALVDTDFAATLPTTGNATTVTIDCVRVSTATGCGDAAPAAGDQQVRVFVTFNNPPNGTETLTIAPATSTSIYSSTNNGTPTSSTTGALALTDKLAPVITSTAPATNASVKTTTVSYTVSEACVADATNSSITWTRTGGTADAGSPRVQALTGSELSTGAHNNITLTNNPALVSGTIYTISFSCKDAAGNISTVISNTGVTYDTTAPVISAVAPASSTSRNSTVVSYTLSEAVASGSIVWTWTGGTAGSNQTANLTGTELNTGAHTGITLTNAPTLVNGAIYTVTFNATDAAGNAATTVTSTSVTFDNAAPTISATAPATNASIKTTVVSYTLSEACAADGTNSVVTWTRTGGTADGGSPHTSALTGTELNSGAHTGITLANAPTLVNGAIYTVAFKCRDAAGNDATVISNTNVTYDTTAPVISAITPATNAYRNNAQIGYTLSEAIASGTVTFTRTGGTADAGSPWTQNLSGTELNTGVHAVAALNSPPTLVSGAVYTITINATDAAGNAATAVSVNTITYDTANPNAPSGVTVPTYTTSTSVSVTIGTLGTDAISFSTHNVKACTSNDCATGCVGATTSATSPVTVSSLVNGTAYYACVQSQDSAGNTSSFVASAATVTVDTSLPVFSSITPATSANVSASDVGYTLSENISSGTITWTRTGGTADPASPITYNLSGAQLSSGARTITAPVTLVSGAIYTVAFSGTDAAGNNGTASSTSVTYAVSGTFSISSAETMDCDLDGHIDHYKITFSSAITDSTFDGYTGTANYGNSVDTEWLINDPSLGQYVNVRFSPPAKTNADCSGVTDTADDTVAYLIFNEKAAYDTGVKPDITGSSTVVKRTTGLIRLYTDTGTWASTDVTETDKAGPIVIAATANEGGAAELGLNVGDTLVISFSEAMTAYNFQGNSVDLDTVFTVGGSNTKFAAFADHNTIAWGSGNTQLTVTFQNGNATIAVGDSIKAINPAYANLTDAAGNLAGNITAGLPVITGTFDSGNKGPVITAVEYKDSNHNGYIDHVKVTFDIAVDATTFPGYAANSLGTVTTNWQIAGYSNLKLDTRTTIETNCPAACEGDASDTDSVIWIAFAEGSDPDTGSKPDLTATTGSVGLRGTAGVGACYLYTAPAACATAASGSLLSTAFTAEADAAAPVIVTATGTLLSNSLFVTFSEPVWTNTAMSGSIVAGDFTYDNDGAGSVTGITSMGSDADASVDGFVIVTVNGNFAAGDFNGDKLGAASAASIYDAANLTMLAGNNATNAYETSILEATKPYLMTASSYYNTTTSKSYLRVLFSEAVNSTALTATNYTLSTQNACTPAVTGNPAAVVQVGGTRRIYDLETTAQSGSCVYEVTGSTSIVDVNEGAPLTSPRTVTTYGTASDDVTKPRILLATATSLNTVLLSFSEPMKTGDVAGSAECKAAGNGYTTSLCDNDMDTSVSGTQLRYGMAPPSLGTVASVAQASNTSEFILTHTTVQTGTYYTVTVYNAATATTPRVCDAKTTGCNVMDITPNNQASFRGMGSSINSFADGPMFQDPFADGTTFAFAFNYAGKVYLGPNDYNSGAFRFEPDGLNPVTVNFSGPTAGSCPSQTTFGTTGLVTTALSGTATVTKGSTSITGSSSSWVTTDGMGSNTYVNIQGIVYKVSAATDTSLTLDTTGYMGSTQSGLTIYKNVYTAPASCSTAPLLGPYGEKGLVGFNSGTLSTLSSLEILTAGPLKQNFGYTYFTQDIDTQLNWKACPISFTGGGNTASPNLVYTFGDSYYVGIASNLNTQAPILFRQQLTESGGVLSCSTGTNINAQKITDIGNSATGGNPANNSSSVVGIDSMLYVASGPATNAFFLANNGGLTYSTGHPADETSFTTVLNTTSFGSGVTLVLPFGAPSDANVGGLGKIRPGQKGIPFIITYKGAMYMARNLAMAQSASQEMVNNGGELWKCTASCTASGNWSKVFDISALSGGANNLAISVLTVNGDALYLGLDNTADGVRIFRATANPITASTDFIQQTTAGLTNPINFKYFFSSTSMAKGGYNYIYVTVMDGKNAINVARQVD